MEKNMEAQVDRNSSPSMEGNFCTSVETILGSGVVTLFLMSKMIFCYIIKSSLRIKKGIPGEKFLGKDHEGWEYTSHDLWKKKLVWKVKQSLRERSFMTTAKLSVLRPNTPPH